MCVCDIFNLRKPLSIMYGTVELGQSEPGFASKSMNALRSLTVSLIAAVLMSVIPVQFTCVCIHLCDIMR